MNNCSYCGLPLRVLHWNSKFDMEICGNEACPKFCNPQGYALNPENKILCDALLAEGSAGKAEAILGTGVATRLNDGWSRGQIDRRKRERQGNKTLAGEK